MPCQKCNVIYLITGAIFIDGPQLMAMIKSSDRISVHFQDEAYSGDEIKTTMFVEDFSQNLVPYTYTANRTQVRCELKPADKAASKLIADLLAPFSQFNSRGDMARSVWNAIGVIANILVTRGEAIFEIVTNVDENDIKSFSLVRMAGQCSIKKQKIIQYLPVHLTQAKGLPASLEIPREKCVVITFPETLGGKKKYLKWFAKFREIESADPYNHFLRNPLSDKKGYDSIKHHAVHELALWSATKGFGWNHRSSSNKLFSNYYTIYRTLKFRKTQFILRDYIISELTEHIHNILKQISFSSQLVFSGLLTIADIDEALEEWNKGSMDIERMGSYLS